MLRDRNLLVNRLKLLNHNRPYFSLDNMGSLGYAHLSKPLDLE